MSRRRLPIFVALLASLLLGSIARAGDEAPRAREYFDWVDGLLDKVKLDMPAITASAEAAAKPIADGKNLGIMGGVGLNSELGGRAGGFFFYNGGGDKSAGAVFWALGVANVDKKDTSAKDAKALLQKELAQCHKDKDAGIVVVGVASMAQLAALELTDEAKAACSFLIDNHAPAEDGLFRDKTNRAVVPTYTVADCIIAWTWSAELFGALTRLGKTPVMYQSFMIVPSGKARAEHYKGQRFHEDIKVAPQDAGRLGSAYLHGLRAVLLDVETASWPSIVSTVGKIDSTLTDGGKVYVYAAGHYPEYHPPGRLAADPGLFLPLNSNRTFIAKPEMADYVLVLGYSWPPGNEDWYDKDNIIRSGGRGVSWVITGYDTKPTDLKPGEIFIDQRWAEGDAVVSVNGYDIKLFPPSAITAETIEWAIEAQVLKDVEEHDAHDLSKKPHAQH